VLYEAVRRGWPAVQGSMPKRLREEVRRYQECGQLRYGFVEVRCEACRALTLVAFSCKGRGLCPSCATRRAIETGVHVEATLPFVAHRQWTLSLPRTLRLAVVKQPSLLKLVETTLVRAVWRWQRTSRGRGQRAGLHGGAVAMVQYFGSRLQLTPHLHVLVPEAAWDEEGRPVEVAAPDDAAVEAVLKRTVRQLAKRWPEGAPPWAEDEYEALQAEAVQERLSLEVDAAPHSSQRLVAVVQGFSLHAGTWVHGNDRQGLERLARYGARGPVAESRLTRREDGRYEYAPKGDSPPLVLTAEVLVKRLLALLPPPRKHLTTFHGVYGPASKLRSRVVRAPEVATTTPTEPSASPAAPQKRTRLDWATLQARTFGEDVWACPCGGRRTVLAVVTSRRTAEEVLQNLGMLTPRRALPQSQAPPQLALAL